MGFGEMDDTEAAAAVAMASWCHVVQHSVLLLQWRWLIEIANEGSSLSTREKLRAGVTGFIDIG